MCLIEDQSWIDCIDITSRWDTFVLFHLYGNKGVSLPLWPIRPRWFHTYSPCGEPLGDGHEGMWARFGSQGSIALNWHSRYSGTRYSGTWLYVVYLRPALRIDCRGDHLWKTVDRSLPRLTGAFFRAWLRLRHGAFWGCAPAPLTKLDLIDWLIDWLIILDPRVFTICMLTSPVSIGFSCQACLVFVFGDFHDRALILVCLNPDMLSEIRFFVDISTLFVCIP